MTTISTFDRTLAVASGTAPIPFNFQAVSTEEVGVLRNNVPEFGTFNVTLNGDGTGTVTPTTSWGTDAVTIFSDPNFEQPANFSRFGPFYPDQMGDVFDRQARQIIALKNRLDRAGPDATLRTDLAGTNGTSLIGVPGGGSLQNAIFVGGHAGAVAGLYANVTWQRQDALPAYPVEGLAALWSDKVTWRNAFSAEFDATNAPVTTPFAAPAATMLLAAHNKGSNTTVLALQTITGVHVGGKEGAGVNHITYCDAGLTSPVLKSLELDIQPGAGSTGVTGFGLGIVAFSMEIGGDYIHLSSNSSGFFTSGIRIDKLNAAAGAGLYAAGPMGSLVNSSTGTFGQDAIILANTHKLRLMGTGAVHAKLYVDASNIRHDVLPSGGMAIREPTDTSTMIFVDPTGNVDLQGGGTLNFAAGVLATTATAGAQTLPANPAGFVIMKMAGTNRKVPYYAT